MPAAAEGGVLAPCQALSSSMTTAKEFQGMEWSDSTSHPGRSARMGPGGNPELEESGY